MVNTRGHKRCKGFPIVRSKSILDQGTFSTEILSSIPSMLGAMRVAHLDYGVLGLAHDVLLHFVTEENPPQAIFGQTLHLSGNSLK